MQEIKNIKICPRCGKLESSEKVFCPLDKTELERKWDLNPREQIRLGEKQKQILKLIDSANKKFRRQWKRTKQLHLHSLTSNKKKSKNNSFDLPILTGFSFLGYKENGLDFDFAISVKKSEGKEFILRCQYQRRPREEDIFFKNLPKEIGNNEHEFLIINELVSCFIYDVWLEREEKKLSFPF